MIMFMSSDDIVVHYPFSLWRATIRGVIRIINFFVFRTFPKHLCHKWGDMLWSGKWYFPRRHGQYRLPNSEECGIRTLRFRGVDSKHIESVVDDLGNYWDSPRGSKPITFPL